jgi:hypothetical protein
MSDQQQQQESSSSVINPEMKEGTMEFVEPSNNDTTIDNDHDSSLCEKKMAAIANSPPKNLYRESLQELLREGSNNNNHHAAATTNECLLQDIKDQ